MSARPPSAATPPGAPAGGSVVGWYCTDRGRHDYAIVSPGYIVWPPAVPGVRTGPLPAVLRCPDCGLTKRVGRRERRRLAGSGRAEVDISTLPY